MLKEFARDLKTIREKKDISLKSIAQQTRLNHAVLENLEHGDFTFQPQTYIRAFLKQYVTALDLDPEEVLFDYDLARSGKYKPKFVHDQEKEHVASVSEQTDETTDLKSNTVSSSPEPGIRKNNSREHLSDSSSDVYHELPETGKVRIIRDLPPKQSVIRTESRKEEETLNILASPVFRKILFAIVGILILLGIYSLINILFIDGSKENPEIIRQNFDEVVKEQEKRLLGKKTPEEIRDSIKKAGENSKAPSDSVFFRLTGLEYGEIYVVTDSTNYTDPKKITYDKGDVRSFKARSSLHITSGNTTTFEAVVNGNPIEFDTKAVRKVKITKDGVQK